MPPKPQLPYVQSIRNKAGKLYWYYRRNKKRYPIKDDEGTPLRPGSPAFLKAYRKIDASCEATGQAYTKDTFGKLIELYRISPGYMGLSDRTKKDYTAHLDHLKATYGKLTVSTMPRGFVIKLRDKHAITPRKANYLVAVLSILMQYAVDLEWRRDNPCLRVKKLKGGPGYLPWPQDLIDAFRTQAPPELVWVMELALWTGQRGGDLITMQWNQINDNVIEVTQSKGGSELTIPCAKPLSATLATIPKHSTRVLTDASGKPWAESNLRQRLRRYVERCGFKGYTLHGLRKNATNALFEAGCTPRQVQAITGHKTTQMLDLYSHQANKKNLATAAIKMLDEHRK